MRTSCVLLLVFAALALSAQFVQARPGRSILGQVQALDPTVEDDTESVHLSSGKADLAKKTELTDLPETKKVEEPFESNAALDTENESQKSDELAEDDVVCTEMGSCYEKRLLTATIDYKNDGPNNPITDPPH